MDDDNAQYNVGVMNIFSECYNLLKIIVSKGVMPWQGILSRI